MDVDLLQQQEPAGGEQARTYKLRKLQARDITPMSKIIGKMGIDQLISCYGDDDFTELMVKLKNRKNVIDSTTEAGIAHGVGKKDNSEFIVGVAVATRIANQVLMSLDRCEKEVYGLLGSLSGMSAEEIAALDLDVFVQMIVEVIRENNVVNFIKAAKKLL